MIFSIVVLTFLGYLLVVNIYSYSLIYVSIKSLAAFCKSFFTLYVTYLIIRELNQKFDFCKNPKELFKLFTYSFTAFWTALLLSGVFADYITLGKFFVFMGLYGIYPLWAGADVLLNIPARLKTKFILLTTVTALTVFLLINWSFGFALRIIYYSELLK